MGKKKIPFQYDFSGASTVSPGTPGFGDTLGPPSGQASVAHPNGIISPGGKEDDIRTLPDAEAEWDSWDDEERQKWADHLIQAGVLPEEKRWDYGELQLWWYKMVQESANKYENANKKVDPWKMAVIYGGGDESGATASSLGRDVMGEGPVARYVTSTRDRSINLTDSEVARALVNQVLGQALGRNASDEEIEEFKNVLNQAERENPVITRQRSVHTLRDDGTDGYDVERTTRTTGGVDAGSVVMDEALESEESKRYQAATTYWTALEQALGTIGGNPV